MRRHGATRRPTSPWHDAPLTPCIGFPAPRQGPIPSKYSWHAFGIPENATFETEITLGAGEHVSRPCPARTPRDTSCFFLFFLSFSLSLLAPRCPSRSHCTAGPATQTITATDWKMPAYDHPQGWEWYGSFSLGSCVPIREVRPHEGHTLYMPGPLPCVRTEAIVLALPSANRMAPSPLIRLWPSTSALPLRASFTTLLLASTPTTLSPRATAKQRRQQRGPRPPHLTTFAFSATRPPSTPINTAAYFGRGGGKVSGCFSKATAAKAALAARSMQRRLLF